ncbi:DnaJ domain-containing protein [Hymenobacter sp. B81]|uniref:J domain-containing protein n=1 Tax=Hymenobacter sp. B81 TaxID=3344878 RepID=UPI0037DD3F31
MKTHYQVLELPEQASADDIRRAYLRLVRLTHPDRTPDPAAHARYLLVNEAYDTLREPARRARYDAQLRAAAAPPPPERPVPPFPGNAYQVLRVPYSASATHIEQAYQRLSRQLRRNTVDPALRRYLAEVEHAYATLRSPQARQQHDARVRGQRPARPAHPMAGLYARYARPARIVCWTALLFFGIILVDKYWTQKLPDERVQSVSFHSGRTRRGGESYHVVQTQHTIFRSEYPFEAGDRVAVWRSTIFHQVRSYLPGAQPTRPPYRVDLFYGVFFFFPLLMALAATIGVWPTASPKRRVDSAAAAVLLLPIIIYLMRAI